METHWRLSNLWSKIVKDRDDGLYCDLEIVCDQRCFNAHRIVLAFPPLTHPLVGTSSVYEIKDSSSVLVERLLDYIYTGTYDELPYKALAKEGQGSYGEAAKLGPAAHVMLHAKMMELGDTYMIEGLSDHASKKFETLLAPETTRNLIADIVPEVYAMNFDSSTIIRKMTVQSLRKKLPPPPLETDLVETIDHVLSVAPEFSVDFVMSYCNQVNYGYSLSTCPTLDMRDAANVIEDIPGTVSTPSQQEAEESY
ncbi:hypothetical protein E4U17_001283 [Claviceps sp. LM77 group G4]|nr:hypothetical protein E4U17_001283 [Claviceps sp. LM77 group G4]KAG6043211.1 hypothetical protein E4U33_001722 [Claviceps sp. LM78 group G4]